MHTRPSSMPASPSGVGRACRSRMPSAPGPGGTPAGWAGHRPYTQTPARTLKSPWPAPAKAWRSRPGGDGEAVGTYGRAGDRGILGAGDAASRVVIWDADVRQ